MSQRSIAVRGFGLMFAVPATIMAIREVVGTALPVGRPVDGIDLVHVTCAAAALALLNAALLMSPRSLGIAALILGHVVLAPPAAYFCLFAMADPVAVIFAAPLLAMVMVTLRPASCPLRSAGVSR